jgi:hypothetical protein
MHRRWRPKYASTLHIVAGEDLQRDQVAGSGDAHPQLRQELNRLGICDHFRLDPRRSKQEVYDRRLWLTGEREPDRCEPPDGFLLDDGFDSVVTGSQAVDEGFGLCICGKCHGEIGIPCEPRFGSNGHGQTADERERDTGLGELSADLTQGGFERGHPRLALRSTGRPGESPNSAPGRSRSHCRS